MKTTCKTCGKFKEHEAKGMCAKCYGKKYRLENLEKVRAASRKWHLENPEKGKEAIKRWQLKNPGKGKAKAKKWQKENPEKANIASKKWRLKNKKKVKAASRKWYLENSERMKAVKRKWYLINKEKVDAATRKWRLENPGKYREITLKRRGYGTVKKGVVDRIINENILKYGILTCEKDKKPCPDNFHIDHIIPVSKGGSNKHNNLQILCAKHNQEKHVETMDYRGKIKNNQLYLSWQMKSEEL